MLFVNPLWFFSAAAITIPVIIHLWNIKPGKTLKVGSIALIDAASRKRSRSLNLLNLLLLFLRCVILILLAFLLSTPFIQNKITFKNQKGWLLIPRANFNETYNKFKQTVDSALRAGFQLHYFETDFRQVELKKALNDTAMSRNSEPSNYWHLLAELNEYLPDGFNVCLLTPGKMLNFIGEKPETNLNKKWKTYTPADSVATWIDQAWFGADKSIQVVEGLTKPSGTTYSRLQINNGTESNSRYLVNVNNGVATIALKGGKAGAVLVDTSTLIIEIFSDKNGSDGQYLKAALESIQTFTGRNLRISNYSPAMKNADWLFWLSEKPFKMNTTVHPKNIFSYASGKIENIDSWLIESHGNSIVQGLDRIPLYKIITSNQLNDHTLWHDGFDRPLLTVKPDKAGNKYQFYSRFSPAWSDLVWNDNFPGMLLNLIFKNNNNNRPDNRIFGNKQLQIQRSNGNESTAKASRINSFFGQYIWLLLAMVILAERWLAYKTEI